MSTSIIVLGITAADINTVLLIIQNEICFYSIKAFFVS